jgi:ABC-2 type transport system permease protein
MLRLVLHQARYDMLGFLRNRQARYSTMLMPVILLGVLLGAFGQHVVGPGQQKASSYYVAGIATLAVLAACFMNLVISLTAQRERGVLKRRRATPVPVAVLVAGRTLTAMVAALATITAVCALGGAGFGVELPATAVPSVVLTVVVASVAFCCIAYALTSVIRSADAAQPIVQAISLPLYFSSGVFIPSISLPGWLQDVARALPVEHLSHALHRAFDPGLHGSTVAWRDLAVLLAWGAAALVIALRRFRWTPTATTR